MCRSIQTLRPPFVEGVTEADIRAAALQYVRKVSGFHHPAPHNEQAFGDAVDTVAQATEELLGRLVIRSGRASPRRPAQSGAGGGAA